MRIIYVHGLDSSANAMKGQMVEQYCSTHYPDIEVLSPDLNMTPNTVFNTLCDMVSGDKTVNDKQTVLIGSSLGGYFSTLVSNATGCPAALLNPSTQPHLSLQRFIDSNSGAKEDIDDLAVIYKTTGGWGITRQDLDWFNDHILDEVVYPERMYAIIKAGDELLNPTVATSFYRSQGVTVDLQDGGDHRMTDFAQQLPKLMQRLEQYRSSQ